MVIAVVIGTITPKLEEAAAPAPPGTAEKVEQCGNSRLLDALVQVAAAAADYSPVVPKEEPQEGRQLQRVDSAAASDATQVKLESGGACDARAASALSPPDSSEERRQQKRQRRQARIEGLMSRSVALRLMTHQGHRFITNFALSNISPAPEPTC
jgi:hypothetical protein